jgi:hypothetical protein
MTTYHSHRSSGNVPVLLFLLALVVFCLALVEGCSSLQVASQSDNTVVFERYKTYAWLAPDAKDVEAMKNSITLRTQTELIQRNADNALQELHINADTTAPDLLFRSHIAAKTETSYINQPRYHYMPGIPWYAGHRMWFSTGGSYFVTNSAYRTQHTDGTILIDAIDRKTGNVIWRGWSSETIQSMSDLNRDIPQAVKKIFERYPVQRQS